ncbi:MAG: AraC family transcriptional regulator [Proteobacteria bacterium]|nr:AraC family transcriptional regulator [Pseudomonadota bacterium]
MLLDHLLDHISLEVEPFAICRVQRGWRLALPAERTVQLHFVVAGSGRLIAGQWSASLSRCTLAIIPAGVDHRVQPDSEVEREVTARAARRHSAAIGAEIIAGDDDNDLGLSMICGRTVATFGEALGLFDQLDQPLVQSFGEAPEVEELFAQLVAEQLAVRPGVRRMTQLYMEQCLVHLFRQLCDGDECALPWLAALEDPQLSRALGAVLAEPAANHSVESLAEAAAMSRSVFSRRFAEAFSTTPGDFVRRVRLRRAAELLRTTDLPIKAIAVRVGFASRSHFSRAFKAELGRNPATYRIDS